MSVTGIVGNHGPLQHSANGIELTAVQSLLQSFAQAFELIFINDNIKATKTSLSPSALNLTISALLLSPDNRNYRSMTAADAGAQQQTCWLPLLLSTVGQTDT